ncbi:hypothetical protein KFU94_43405 [Chloroflexi bacterium TSY]|nr:hypothetical protein [Chloroflexi bacterium TSY]
MLTLNLKNLDLDADELADKLHAFQEAGLQIRLQVKGNRTQTLDLLDQLVGVDTKAVARRRLVSAVLPAAAGGVVTMVIGTILALA